MWVSENCFRGTAFFVYVSSGLELYSEMASKWHSKQVKVGKFNVENSIVHQNVLLENLNMSIARQLG